MILRLTNRINKIAGQNHLNMVGKIIKKWPKAKKQMKIWSKIVVKENQLKEKSKNIDKNLYRKKVEILAKITELEEIIKQWLK